MLFFNDDEVRPMAYWDNIRDYCRDVVLSRGSDELSFIRDRPLLCNFVEQACFDGEPF